MSRRTVLSWAFTAATAVVVGWELWAAARPGDDWEPWTNLLADHVPAPILMAGVYLLVSWLPGHMAEAIAKRKGTTVNDIEIPATPDPGAPREPLVSVGFVVSGAAAVIGVLVAFGLNLSETKTNAILALIVVLAPLIVVLVGRLKVFSPATARLMVVDAARRGATRTEPSPPAR